MGLTLGLAACLAVAGCGSSGKKATVVPTAAAAVGDPTPKIGVNGATVSIENGSLDPSTITGLVRNGFLLTIHGNGQPHTIAIPTLLAKADVKANGDTSIRFSINKDQAGKKTILLDGKDAGTFVVELPSGTSQ